MKIGILMCVCSGVCPSMTKINFFELMERLRLEVPHEFMVLHPRLCEENGGALMQDLLKADTVYVTAACNEKHQGKLLAAGFSKAGVPMDEKHWIPVTLAQKDTDQAFADIKAAVEKARGMAS
jgi:heterodisulfide reductase subunit A-like polyferredoxin